MKNQGFTDRFRAAFVGVVQAWRGELSFRIECGLGLGAIATLFVIQPKPVWWALFGLAVGGVLGAELLNTAIEKTLDKLHPGRDPVIGQAKDLAAAGVFAMSVASIVVYVALLVDTL